METLLIAENVKESFTSDNADTANTAASTEGSIYRAEATVDNSNVTADVTVEDAETTDEQ